jgi:hypothetical protein
VADDDAVLFLHWLDQRSLHSDLVGDVAANVVSDPAVRDLDMAGIRGHVAAHFTPVAIDAFDGAVREWRAAVEKATRAPEPRLPVPGTDPTYLGDGAYVAHEPGIGYLWLWTQREDGVHSVALDHSAFAALVRYARRHGYDIPEVERG